MTQPGLHLSDESLSAHLDARLTAAEDASAQAHLATCAACQARLAELRSLVGLLRQLPGVPLPRDFQLAGHRGLVALPDPARVIRLRRWYTATRAVAATLAAAFVVLSVSTLYVDSRPGVRTSALPAGPAASEAGGAAALTAPTRSAAAAVAPRAAAVATRPAAPAPAAPAVQPPAPGLAAPAQRAAAPSTAQDAAAAEGADQTVAATSARPLPTAAPTAPRPAVPTVAPRTLPSAPVEPAEAVDAAAPLRTAAVGAGVLAAFGLLFTLIVRERLRAAAHPRTE